MPLPNFLIIGAAKAGTTSLHHYLHQHPQVYLSTPKEPAFFAFEGEAHPYKTPGDGQWLKKVVTRLDDYQRLFEQPALAKGEASVVYLYSTKAPERIKHHVPDAKLIAILRDPVARAYSNYLQLRRDGREPIQDFLTAFEQSEVRAQADWRHIWHYKQMGFYFEQLSHYWNLFPANQIRVYLYEDFSKDPLAISQDIFRFLDVDSDFRPDVAPQANVSGLPKNRFLFHWVNNDNWAKTLLLRVFPLKLLRYVADGVNRRNLVRPPLPPHVRAQLLPIYQNDIRQLQGLIGSDLSTWLK